MTHLSQTLSKLASAQTCSGCTACYAICPKRAISFVQNDEGFRFPQIDASLCVGCGACERVCPVLHPAESREPLVCYAAYTRDEKLRLASSSGGLFTEFAKPILENGGVVFGCRLNESLVAEHTKVDSLEGLAALRGSKYVQSDLKDTFREAKAELQAGRQVLFSGTPCQIAGLNHYLNRDYPNLITLEVICHGAPSPAVFEKFKVETERAYGSTVSHLSFRKKEPSWRRSKLEWQFDGNRSQQEDLYANPYIRAFLSDVSLRSSCYLCSAKGGKSRADVTLGDFWGIETVCPDLDDDKGISAVLLHTQKAQTLWAEIAAGVVSREVALGDVTRGNPAYYRPVAQPKGRGYFMAHFRDASIASVYTRSAFGPWYIRIARRLLSLPKRVLRKVYHLLKGMTK